MNQYRSTFWLYLIIWLALALLPAAFTLFGGTGRNELRQMYADTQQNVAIPMLEKYGLVTSDSDGQKWFWEKRDMQNGAIPESSGTER